jgi:hypothetical protein
MGISVSEIEFRTPYVVAERLIVALMLRFKPAKKRSFRHTGIMSPDLSNLDKSPGRRAQKRSPPDDSYAA